MDSSTTASILSDDSMCAQYETYTLTRFILIVIATLIAAVGTAANMVLVYIFMTKKSIPTTPATLYPTVLAVLDVAICFEYILLFGVDAVVSYVQIESLFSLYYIYIIPAYVLSRITQLAIPYMLIFATLERLVWTYHDIRSKYLRALYSPSGRHWTIIVSFIAFILLRLPTAFAMEVGEYPDCDDFFRTLTTQPREWAQESISYHVFDFHIMTIAQTLVPFILLFVLNMIIVQKMGRDDTSKDDDDVCDSPPPPPPLQIHTQKLLPEDSPRTTLALTFQPLKTMNSNVRKAIFTMTAIVTSYLISNILHLILTIMERSHHPWLIDDEDPLLSSTFHTFFSDMVSFVYMFTSAIRILIYFGFNNVIRKDIKDFFRRSNSSEDVVDL